MGDADGDGPTYQPITRELLADGTLLSKLRANPDLNIKSDEEICFSLDETLRNRPPAEDHIWLFAYGSLMWNPAIEFERSSRAVLRGWHRRFCIQVPYGRGTPDRPALFLALDRGGVTEGVAFKLYSRQERAELELIWMREMFSDAHLARWVRVETNEGQRLAITFVANREGASYRKGLTENDIAMMIGAATGSLGSNLEYLEETLKHLSDIGVRERRFERLQTLLR